MQAGAAAGAHATVKDKTSTCNARKVQSEPHATLIPVFNCWCARMLHLDTNISVLFLFFFPRSSQLDCSPPEQLDCPRIFTQECASRLQNRAS